MCLDLRSQYFFKRISALSLTSVVLFKKAAGYIEDKVFKYVHFSSLIIIIPFINFDVFIN